MQEFHLLKSTELCLQSTSSKRAASFCIINNSPFPVYYENTIKCLKNLTTRFYFPLSPHLCPHIPTPKTKSVILVFHHNWIHMTHALICFIRPPDSVPSCYEECTPRWAVPVAGKGRGIYSSFNSRSKAITSQLR